jgi:hypothetical protein
MIALRGAPAVPAHAQEDNSYPKHRFVTMPALLIIGAVDLTFFASNSLRAVDG